MCPASAFRLLDYKGRYGTLQVQLRLLTIQSYIVYQLLQLQLVGMSEFQCEFSSKEFTTQRTANSGIIGPKLYLCTVLLGRPNPKLMDVDLLL